MNILLLSPTQPVPATDGARLRILNFIKNISRKNKITLITLNHQDCFNVKGMERKLSKYCQKIYGINHYKPKPLALLYWFISRNPYRHVKVYNPLFKKVIKYELTRYKYDVVYCNFLDMAQYISPVLRQYTSALFVIDQHNADELWYEKFVKMKHPLMKAFGRENIKRLHRLQKQEYKTFDLCLSVSEEEANYTKKLLGNSIEIEVAPNGVDLDYYSACRKNKLGNIILFCGSMDTIMNQDAVFNFYHKIFPRIKKQMSNVKFVITGRNPSRKIRKLNNNKDIIVTGTVNDVRQYYEKASVVVAPFRLGGGTKLKILEAMAMKVPIVSTSIGCQGIKVKNGNDLWIADNDFEFAEKVIETLKQKSDRMIDKAYNLVLKKYSWKKITGHVEAVIREKRKIRELQNKMK
jgi:glycosyltransferase involved in cell wall biosynthesis